MDKKIGEEIVNEIVEIINQHRIVEKHNPPKSPKKHTAKTLGIFSCSIIIAFTIAIHTDFLKKTLSLTVTKNLTVDYKKNPHVYTWGNISPSEINFTTQMEYPEYLDEVYSTDAGSDPVDFRIEDETTPI